MQTFGEQLIAARRAKGMTQEQLSNAVKVARNTISSWEHDRTTPDVAAAQCLSAVLECDFIQPVDIPDIEPDADSEANIADNEADANDESISEIAASDSASFPELEAWLASENTSGGLDAASKSLARRHIVPWLIAGVALLACIVLGCLLLIRKPQVTAGSNAFPVEYYNQETINDPERAYLSFSDRYWDEKSEGAVYARYAFTMNEHNGKPFHITRIEVRHQGADGQDRTLVLSADDLRAADLDPDIPAYGSLTLDGGFPKVDFLRVGIAVFGEDADGAANVFYDLIEF